jgi:hypothetical protein
MQHVSTDDVQNAEASQDGDRPRPESWRRSPGLGAIGNCHIRNTFLYVFENSTVTLKALLRDQMLVLTDDVLRLKAS